MDIVAIIVLSLVFSMIGTCLSYFALSLFAGRTIESLQNENADLLLDMAEMKALYDLYLDQHGLLADYRQHGPRLESEG